MYVRVENLNIIKIYGERMIFFSLFFFFFFLSLRARYNALPRVSQEWNTIFISVIRLVKNVNLNFTRVNKEQRLLSHCAG